MILIDKLNNTNILYATLKELTSSETPIYKLEIFSFYTNVTYNYNVTIVDSSSRIDKLSIDLSSELSSKTLLEGLYKYTFYEVLEIADNIVETGMVKVIDTSEAVSADDDFLALDEEEIADDFIVYQNNI